MRQLYIVIAFILPLLFSCKKDKQTPADEFEKVKVFDFESEKVIRSGNDFMLLSSNSFLKISNEGDFLWSQKRTYYLEKDTVLSTSDNFPQALLPLDDGKAIISGIAKHYENYYCCLQFLNQDGTNSSSKRILLNQYIPNIFEIKIKSVLKTSSNLFLIGDYTDKSNSRSYFVIKTDANANFIWKKEYLFSHFDDESSINSSVKMTNGNILLAGNSGQYIVLSSISSEGNLLWSKDYNKGNWLNKATNIVTTSDGNYCITGYADMSSNNNSFNYNFLMLKINPADGNTIWFKELGTDKQDFCVSSSATSDGGFILVGTTNRQTQAVSDSKSYMYLLKLNESGEQEWFRKIGEDYALQGLNGTPNGENTYSIIGNKQGYGNSNVLHTLFIKTKSIQ